MAENVSHGLIKFLLSSNSPDLIHFLLKGLCNNIYKNLTWKNEEAYAFILRYPKIKIPSAIFSDEEREAYLTIFKDYDVLMKHKSSFNEVGAKRRLVEAMTGSIYIKKVKSEKQGLPGFSALNNNYDDMSIHHFRFLNKEEIIVKRNQKRQKKKRLNKRSSGTDDDKEPKRRKRHGSGGSMDSGYESYPNDSDAVYQVEAESHASTGTFNAHACPETRVTICFREGESLPTSLDTSLYCDKPLLVSAPSMQQTNSLSSADSREELELDDNVLDAIACDPEYGDIPDFCFCDFFRFTPMMQSCQLDEV